MAENDIVALKELASGGFLEVALAPADIAAAPSSHTHAAADITDLSAAAAGALYDSALNATGAVVSDANLRLINGNGHEAILAYENITSNRIIGLPNASGTLGLAEPSDSTFRIVGSSDASKKVAFEVDGVSASTTRTLTVPDASGTLARTEDFAAPPAIGSTTPAAISGTTGTFTALTANNGTLTASAPVLNLAQTWNAGGTAFTALNLEVTNTASAVGSTLISLNDASINQGFYVRRSAQGQYYCDFGSAGVGRSQIANRLGLYVLGTERVRVDGSGNFFVMSNGGFHWHNSSSNPLSGSSDLSIVRDAAGTLAQGNGTNPQTFRLYTTVGGTGNVNFERLFLKGNTGGAFQIGTEKGGTGSARALEFQTDGVTRMTLGDAGGVTLADAQDIAVGTTTGTKIGTATTQKIGFFNASPVVQQAAVADATDAASTQDRLNDLLARLRTLGLIAT